MKLSLWWKDAITKIIFIYIVFQFLRNCYSLFDAITPASNPLVPSSLSDYIAFPYYFLIVFWALALVLFYKFLKDKNLQQHRFWIIPCTLIIFLFVAFLLYLLLMKINPFS